LPTLSVRLVGGPTAVLEYAGLRWLTDPTFSAPGEYAGGLVKTSGPAITIDELGAIDVVLVSHDPGNGVTGRLHLPERGTTIWA
jgi:L-ascorbate metabolism protein UlaG (beta-lactamase superfamily)